MGPEVHLPTVRRELAGRRAPAGPSTFAPTGCAKGSLFRRRKENEFRLLLHLMHSLWSSSSFSASSLLGPGPRTDLGRGESTASTRLVDDTELN
eukprot:scaffold4949_cov134-Cylindrotheca_fusiformis.AAC.6